jgi:hypothetical protein
MSDIKNQTVFICIVNSFNGDGQLHHTQVGGQVATGFGNTVHQELANLVAKYELFLLGKVLQVIVTFDIWKDLHKASLPIILFSFSS